MLFVSLGGGGLLSGSLLSTKPFSRHIVEFLVKLGLWREMTDNKSLRKGER